MTKYLIFVMEWGVVASVDSEPKYCITVAFSTMRITYTKEGQEYSNIRPTLSHEEYSMDTVDFKPRVIHVRRTEGGKPERRVVVAFVNNLPLCLDGCETLDQILTCRNARLWYYWEEIPNEEVVELTIEDISNGKGVGIPPHLIRIKK